jgi:hypothetical protein
VQTKSEAHLALSRDPLDQPVRTLLPNNERCGLPKLPRRLCLDHEQTGKLFSVNGVSRTILDMMDTEISIYFRPAAIAFVREPLASSSFSAHTYAPPSLFFLI